MSKFVVNKHLPLLSSIMPNVRSSAVVIILPRSPYFFAIVSNQHTNTVLHVRSFSFSLSRIFLSWDRKHSRSSQSSAIGFIGKVNRVSVSIINYVCFFCNILIAMLVRLLQFRKEFRFIMDWYCFNFAFTSIIKTLLGVY